MVLLEPLTEKEDQATNGDDMIRTRLVTDPYYNFQNRRSEIDRFMNRGDEELDDPRFSSLVHISERDYVNAMNSVRDAYTGSEDPNDYVTRMALGKIVGDYLRIDPKVASDNIEDLYYKATGYRGNVKSDGEHLVNTFNSAGSSLLAGIKTLGFLVGSKFKGLSKEETDNEYEKFKNTALTRYAKNYRSDVYLGENDGFLLDMFTSAANILPSMLPTIALSGIVAAASAVSGGTATPALAGGLVGLAKGWKTMSSASRAVNVVKNIGSYGITAIMEAGGTALTMMDAGFDRDVVLATSAAVGILNGAIENMSAVEDKLTRPIETIFKNIARRDADTIIKKTIRSTFSEIGKDYLSSLVTEPFEEAAQEISSMLAFNFALAYQDATGRPLNGTTPYTADDFGNAIYETMLETLKGTAVLGLGGSITRYGTERFFGDLGRTKRADNVTLETDANGNRAENVIPTKMIRKNTQRSSSIPEGKVNAINVALIGNEYIPIGNTPEQDYVIENNSHVYGVIQNYSPDWASNPIYTNSGEVSLDVAESALKNAFSNNELSGYAYVNKASDGSITETARNKAEYIAVQASGIDGISLFRISDDSDFNTREFEQEAFGKVFESVSDEEPRKKAESKPYSSNTGAQSDTEYLSADEDEEASENSYSPDEPYSELENTAEGIKTEISTIESGNIVESAINNGNAEANISIEHTNINSEEPRPFAESEKNRSNRESVINEDLSEQDKESVKTFRDNIRKAYKNSEIGKSGDAVSAISDAAIFIAKKFAEAQNKSFSEFVGSISKIKSGKAENKKVGGFYDLAKKAITITENAEPTSFTHEVGHHFLNTLEDGPVKDLITRVYASQIKKDGGKIGVKTNEKFSEDLDRYIFLNKTSNKELKNIFDRLLEVCSGLWKWFSNKMRLSSESRAMFDYLFGDGDDRQAALTKLEKAIDTRNRRFSKNQEIAEKASSMTRKEIVAERNKKLLEDKAREEMVEAELATAEKESDEIEETIKHNEKILLAKIREESENNQIQDDEVSSDPFFSIRKTVVEARNLLKGSRNRTIESWDTEKNPHDLDSVEVKSAPFIIYNGEIGEKRRIETLEELRSAIEMNAIPGMSSELSDDPSSLELRPIEDARIGELISSVTNTDYRYNIELFIDNLGNIYARTSTGLAQEQSGNFFKYRYNRDRAFYVFIPVSEAYQDSTFGLVSMSEEYDMAEANKSIFDNPNSDEATLFPGADYDFRLITDAFLKNLALIQSTGESQLQKLTESGILYDMTNSDDVPVEQVEETANFIMDSFSSDEISKLIDAIETAEDRSSSIEKFLENDKVRLLTEGYSDDVKTAISRKLYDYIQYAGNSYSYVAKKLSKGLTGDISALKESIGHLKTIYDKAKSHADRVGTLKTAFKKRLNQSNIVYGDMIRFLENKISMNESKAKDFLSLLVNSHGGIENMSINVDGYFDSPLIQLLNFANSKGKVSDSFSNTEYVELSQRLLREFGNFKTKNTPKSILVDLLSKLGASTSENILRLYREGKLTPSILENVVADIKAMNEDNVVLKRNEAALRSKLAEMDSINAEIRKEMSEYKKAFDDIIKAADPNTEEGKITIDNAKQTYLNALKAIQDRYSIDSIISEKNKLTETIRMQKEEIGILMKSNEYMEIEKAISDFNKYFSEITEAYSHGDARGGSLVRNVVDKLKIKRKGPITLYPTLFDSRWNGYDMSEFRNFAETHLGMHVEDGMLVFEKTLNDLTLQELGEFEDIVERFMTQSQVLRNQLEAEHKRNIENFQNSLIRSVFKSNGKAITDEEINEILENSLSDKRPDSDTEQQKKKRSLIKDSLRDSEILYNLTRRISPELTDYLFYGRVNGSVVTESLNSMTNTEKSAVRNRIEGFYTKTAEIFGIKNPSDVRARINELFSEKTTKLGSMTLNEFMRNNNINFGQVKKNGNRYDIEYASDLNPKYKALAKVVLERQRKVMIMRDKAKRKLNRSISIRNDLTSEVKGRYFGDIQMSKEASEYAKQIKEASGKNISPGEANVLGALFALIPEETRKRISESNRGILFRSGYDANIKLLEEGGVRGASDIANSIIYLSEASDGSTVFHEGEHILLHTDSSLMQEGSRLYKEAIANKEQRAQLKRHLRQFKAIIGMEPENAIEILGNMSDVWSEAEEELVVRIGETHRIAADNSHLPEPLKVFFDKLKSMIQRVYYTVTGKTDVPDSIRYYYDSMWTNATFSDLVKDANGKDVLLYQGAWHGGSADFAKFSTDFIGSGEGEQAFGWGLYFSDVKEISEGYAEASYYKNRYNTNKKGQLHAKINMLAEHLPKHNSDLNAFFEYHESADNTLMDFYDYDELISVFNYDLKEINDAINNDKLNAYDDFVNYYNNLKSIVEDTLSALEDIGKEEWNRTVPRPMHRNLYEVRIPDGTYISWNEKTPEGILSTLMEDPIVSSSYFEYMKESNPDISDAQIISHIYQDNMTFNKLYNILAKSITKSSNIDGRQYLSQLLRKSGYVGISYPTGTLSSGDKSNRNYVVFDADDVEIRNHYRWQSNSVDEINEGLQRDIDRYENYLANMYSDKNADNINEYSMQKLMGIYEMSKQESALRTLMQNESNIGSGNNIPLENILWIIDQFENNKEYSKYRDLADYMQSDIGSEEVFDKMNDIYYSINNDVLDREEFYSTEFREGDGLSSRMHENIETKFENADSGDRKKPNATVTEVRKRVGSDRPIRLDYVNNFFRTVSDQEHYMAFAEKMDEYAKIFATDGMFAEAIRAKGNISNKDLSKILTNIQKSIASIAKKNVYTADVGTEMLNKIRNNMTQAVMWMNFSSAMQNIPNYMHTVSSMSVGHSFKWLASFISNYKNNKNLIDNISPQMKDRMREELYTARNPEKSYSQSGLSKLFDQTFGSNATDKVRLWTYKVVDFGVRVVQSVEDFVAHAMWWAYYQENINVKYRDSSNDPNFLRLCAEDATQQVMNFFPSQNMKDTPLLYTTHDTGLRNLLIFTSQLNKIFNVYYGSASDFWNEKTFDNFKKVMRTWGVTTAMIIATAAISGRYIPDDDDDDMTEWLGYSLKNTLAEIASITPIVGTTLRSVIANEHYSDTNILSSSLNLAKVISKDKDERRENQLIKAWKTEIVNAMQLIGGPSSLVNKAMNMVIDDNFGELINSDYGNLDILSFDIIGF